jgi:chromosome segregation ATPase
MLRDTQNQLMERYEFLRKQAVHAVETLHDRATAISALEKQLQEFLNRVEIRAQGGVVASDDAAEEPSPLGALHAELSTICSQVTQALESHSTLSVQLKNRATTLDTYDRQAAERLQEMDLVKGNPSQKRFLRIWIGLLVILLGVRLINPWRMF